MNRKLAYLAIAASPGIFKIFVIFALGVISTNTQGVVASELSIINAALMLTAIGIGTQLLHLISKEEKDGKRATSQINGIVLTLIPGIGTICTLLALTATSTAGLLTHPIETSLLLFTSSLYWIYRHFHLARQAILRLLTLELAVWIITATGLIFLNFHKNVESQSIIALLAISYFTAILPELYNLINGRSIKTPHIYRQALVIGLSNLASGGVINLIPKIAFHFSGPALAGLSGLVLNIALAPLTIIRAYLLRVTPSLSHNITSKQEENRFAEIYHNSERIVRKLVLAGFFLTAIASLSSIYVLGSDISQIDILLVSLAIALIVNVPQWSAVDSILINFVDRSGYMLLLNTGHSAFSFSALVVSNFFATSGELRLTTFLVFSSILFLGRNRLASYQVKSILRQRGLL